MKETNYQRSHKKKYNLNSPMSIKKIEIVVKYLPTKEIPGPDGFDAKFLQTFKEEIILILSNLLQIFEKEGMLLNSF